MLYLLYGEDTYRSKKNLQSIVDKFLSTGSASNLLRTTPENFNAAELFDATHSSALLGGKYLYVGDGLLSDAESKDVIINELAAIKDSENIFIFIETSISDDLISTLEDNGGKVTEFAPLSGARLKKFLAAEAHERGVKVSEDELNAIVAAHGGDLWGAVQDIEKLALGGEVNVVSEHTSDEGEKMFDLTDAVAARDARRSVLLYEKYRSQGVPVEEIAWRILWQLKTLGMLQSLAGRSPLEIKKETGLHEYVIKKSGAALTKWDRHDARVNYTSLLAAMQAARIGDTDLDYAITEFLLFK